MRRSAVTTSTVFAAFLALAVLLLAMVPRDSRAMRAVAKMTASVVVLPFTRITPLYQAERLRITAEDVAREYVEVRKALVLRVQSNHRQGHRLVVEPTGQDFSRVQVLGLGGTPATLGGSGGAVALPGAASGEQTYTLGFRLFLAPGKEPGEYAWPLAAFVEPR
jgi:hypothetical protein